VTTGGGTAKKGKTDTPPESNLTVDRRGKQPGKPSELLDSRGNEGEKRLRVGKPENSGGSKGRSVNPRRQWDSVGKGVAGTSKKVKEHPRRVRQRVSPMRHFAKCFEGKK